MKIICWILFCFVTLHNICAAEYFNYDVSGGQQVIDSDIVVSDGVFIAPEKLEVAESVRIDNYGTIDSDIYVCDRCEVQITNYGSVLSDFYLGVDANIVQIVTDNDNMKRIDFNVPFDVVLNADTEMDLASVLDFANDADSVFITDTVLNINSVPIDINGVVHFDAGVVLNVGDLDIVGDMLILDNVTANANLRFVGVGNNPMYVSRGYISNGGLYVQRVRETDYTKVLGGRVGDYLNSLRGVDGADRFMSLLDSAADFNEIDNLIGKTVRLNPHILVNKLATVHMFDVLDNNVTNKGAGLSLFGVMDSDMLTLGVGAGYVYDVHSGFSLGADLRIAKMMYSSDIDEFDANMYSGRIMANYNLYEQMFIHGMFGMWYTDPDLDVVFYNGDVVNNPGLWSGYLTTDVGYKLTCGDYGYVAPIVGLDAHLYKTTGFELHEIFGRVGAEFGYVFESNAVEYQYVLRAYLNTDAVPSVMGRIGFWTPMDGFGGDLQFGIMHINDVAGYNFSINAKMAF